jgi:hypothetical protein
MYALWKTQGVTVQPWRSDVRFGAVRENGTLYLSVIAEQAWQGKLVFDKQRHKINMRLPVDYPRINQFPEWFTALPDARYEVCPLPSGKTELRSGLELTEGVPVSLEAGVEARWTVKQSEKQ